MKLLSTVALLSTMLWASSSFALTTLKCNASMVGRGAGYGPKGQVAPTLVLYSHDVVATYKDNSLALTFNLKTIEKEGSYVILDGRPRMVGMNVHVKITSKANGVEVKMTDRISGSETIKIVNNVNAYEVQQVASEAGYMDLNCTLL